MIGSDRVVSWWQRGRRISLTHIRRGKDLSVTANSPTVTWEVLRLKFWLLFAIDNV